MQEEHERNERHGAARSGLIRGILVIFTAVAIGAFVISQGLENSETMAAGSEVAVGGGEADNSAGSGDASDPSDSGAAAESSAADGSTPQAAADGTTDGTATDGVDDTTTTTDPIDNTPTTATGPIVQVPDEVSVLVLNGAGAKGIAGRGAAILQEAEYDVLAPKNADLLGPSLVLYAEGYEEAAVAVAKVFGADPLAVVKAFDPANKPIADTQNANIIVVVGQDGLIDV